MNFYVANTNGCNAILFSKTDVAIFQTLYPKSLFFVETDFEKAVDVAKPRNATSNRCYAVKIGRVKGIYFSEKLYHAMVNGFRDAYGKKCLIKNAYFFIYGKQMPIPKKITSQTTNFAYTDGSLSSSGTVGIGYRLFYNGEFYNNSSFFQLPDKNVTSLECEIFSVMLVVRDAINLGLKDILIYCDNQNVVGCSEKILKQNVVYQNYLRFLKDCKPRINVYLKKVKGHSTDTQNNIVDKIVGTKRIDKVLKMAYEKEGNQ